MSMNLTRSMFLDSKIGVIQELPRSGSALENPYVYDSVARDFKHMATKGLVEIVAERRRPIADDLLIDSLQYRRLRQG
jgi:hypothetical protein